MHNSGGTEKALWQTLRIQDRQCFRSKSTGVTTKCHIPINTLLIGFSFENVLCMQPLEGRVVMSLKTYAWNLTASATHSCESHRFVVEPQRDTLPFPLCHIYPWAMNQNPSRMGLACLLILFCTTCMWSASGPRTELSRLASGTNGPESRETQID